MTEPQHTALNGPSRKRRLGRWFFPVATAACVGAMLFLGQGVVKDLRELRSATKDTVQWTLSQVESEFLGLQLTLHDTLQGTLPGLRTLRKDFDVFFSRHDIIANGAVFADARKDINFSESDKAIDAFLTRTAPLIDGSDAALTQALPQILAEATELRPVVRGLYVSGLSHFAEDNDQLRERLSITLWKLSGVTAGLIASLLALAVYSRRTANKSATRGRELSRANAHMETILSTSLDGVIVSDQDGCVVDFNAAAEQIFGYKLEDIIGKNIGDLIVPPDLRDAHAAGMARMIRTGQHKLVGKGRIRIEACRADGSLFPIELALQSGIGENGQIFIAFLRDISPEVEAEEELREARDAALAGEKAKAEFLAVMSHEIRTPLSGLLGNLTLLKDTSLSGDQDQYIGNMDISGRQLMGHVNAVLDIAKFESGRLEVADTAFHLGQFLQEIVDGQSGLAENRNTSISWNWIGPELDWIHSDSGHLEQVLMNLVGNAIKFTSDGRIDIEAEQVGGTPSGPLVEFRVIDTGIGIAEENQAKVFDDFESSSRSGGQTGSTGLGLGIAKRLVSLLNGEIGVESTLGEGSVFWVRIPVKKALQPQPEDAVDDQSTAQNELSILLVEDNDMNAFVVEKMLDNEGHKVTWAKDGLEAIAWAEKAVFDVILMDINMPKLGGLEATQRIRSKIEQANDTPIFAFSANVLPADTKRFRESGMDGFIGKPVQIDEMRAALNSAAKRKTAPPVAPPKTAAEPPAETTPEETDMSQDAKEMFGENYNTFLARFLNEGDVLAEWLGSVEAQVATANPEIFEQCHKISATAALFGAEAFHAALQSLEMQAKTDAETVHTDLISDVMMTWKDARLALTTG